MTNDAHGNSPEFTDDEIRASRSRAVAVPADLRAEFTDRLRAWKSTWSRPEVFLSSDTRDYATGPEFEAILALGEQAVPLVVEQITHEPDGFFLLAALERWQGRDDLVAVTEQHPLESQQSRARRAVRELLAE